MKKVMVNTSVKRLAMAIALVWCVMSGVQSQTVHNTNTSQSCNLIVNIGSQYYLEAINHPWLEVYVGDEEYPNFEFFRSWSSGGQIVLVPVPENVPIRVVWHEPDTVYNSSYCTIYDPSGTVLFEKQAYMYVDNGNILNYTPVCGNDSIQGIVYVKPGGTGSGSSWDDALPSLQVAVLKAFSHQADVWVAAGTYYGDTTSESAFTMFEGVNVYGGFAGNEPADYNLALRDFETNTTVLDGQNVRRVLYQPSSFNTWTVWDGFTIQNGQISGNGGGAYLRGYGVLAHCVIQNNTANYGGGVYAYYNARVSNCLIANNTATYGGGIYTYYSNIANTTIVRNKATYGSGVYSSSYYGGITNSIIWGNGVDESNNIYGNANCSYSAVEGGFEGTQIIPLSHFNSPLFVNPSTTSGAGTYISDADWHLQNGSVCINRGNNNALMDSLDLDGLSRVKRDTVDLGCYESDFYSSPVIYPNYTNIIYVTQSGSGTQTGEDWANATSSISYALAVAKTAHADVWVAAGTYYGDTSSANAFTMRSGVNVYGGFAGNEPANYNLSMRDFNANTTILDGQNVRRVLYQASSFSDTTVWDGFTIQNGYVQNYGYGGGAYLNGKGILSHCVIKNNRAYYGGGVYAYYNSIVSNCLIVNNTATYSGGGVYGYQATISNSTIVRNMANTVTGLYGYLGSLNNSIVWGNGGDETKNISGSIQCSYSAVEGGCEGDSVVALSLFNAPKFVNPSSVSGVSDAISNADWHLQQGSVCVNRGNNVLVTDSVDLDGMVRIKRDTVDLGCYESDYEKAPIIIPSYTNIVYVKQDGAGVQTGEDWANATSSLSHALTVAKENHADVWVAAGTYYGNTSATNAFTMVEGVNVYGGFAGNEPANYDLSLRDFGTNTTILDGQNTRRVLYQPNSFSDTTVWDGFTIQNGQTTNYANGGGAYLVNNGKLSHCVIRNNTAYYGGGVYAVGAEVSNCKITHNSGTYGGGVEATQNARVSNCEVTHNNAYNGGGIYATYNTIISNCLVANNTATSMGGGVYNYYAEIINSTIVRNLANSGSGFYSYYGDITNSIVWGNGEDVSKNVSGSVSWSYCAVEGGYLNNHNIVLLDVIQQTPKFVRPSLTSGASDSTANVDWHLQEGSVCINHGTNENVIDSLDLDGTVRVKRDTVDMGCYESDYSSSPVVIPIVYVTQNGAGARTGADWANAVSSIAEAQTMAQTTHGVVWVAAGTYCGDTTATNAFTMCNMVNVYGGFAGNEPADYDLSLRDFERNTTILDGRNERRVLSQSGSFNSTTEWDGFTIQNGRTTTYGSGGGANLSGRGKLSHCIVKNNTGYYGGGVYAYYNSEISNCLIVDNTATYAGGGVYSYSATITNTTIVKNKATTGFGIYGSGGNLTNCIVWGNGENGVENISGDISCSYSAIEGGFANGNHVITLASENYGSADNKDYPWFVSPDNGDFHLYRKSSLINRGTNTAGIANTDLDNKTRVYNDTVDIGCYEFHGEEYCVSFASLTVQDVTTNAAMLTWQNPDADASAHCELSYRMVGDSTWQTIDSIMTDRYVLTGLQPQTAYEVRVRNVCDVDNASPYSEVKRFHTRCSSGFETVTIGETTTTNYGGTIPSSIYYYYTYSQQIYRASEIGRGVHVDTLYFQYYNSVTSTRNVNIYMGHTQKTEFSNSSDWVPLSDLTLVYSGNVAFNNAGPDYWFAIPLATAFEYNGSDNIVVAFDDNTGSYSSSGSSFYTHSTSGYNSSMYMYSDGVDYNPASLVGGSGSRCSYRNNIRFSGTCVEDSCTRTVFAAVTNVTDNSAQIELAFENGASDFELEYKELESDTYIVLSPTGNTVLLTGLRQNTRYEIRVRTVCNAGYSDWNRKRFTTEVVNYNHIYVTETGTGDGGSWTTATNDFHWALNTARRIRETYGTMTDVWVATGIYYGDTTGQNAFVMVDGVNVYGGFAGNEPANYDLSYRNLEANTTILDGKHARRVLYQPSSFEKQTVWDGFTIQNGQTTENGGGACLRNKGKLSRCIIKNNTANTGGGVYEDNNSEISNCLLANNTAELGGGVYNYYAIISNSTIVRNMAYEGSGVYGTSAGSYLTNSIVWGNGEDEIKNISGHITCSNSAVEGGFAGDQNILLSDHIQQTPKFVRPSLTSGAMDTTSNVDWHLQNGSVCINHGDNYIFYDSLDLDGAARVRRDTVDMGCYESDYYSSPVLNLNYTGIIYVTQNGAGTQTGEDWANATSSLSFALVLARAYNADIWVAAGTYYGDTAVTSGNAFTMVDGVNVYGGFAGNEPANYDLSQRNFETNTTILDGQNMRRVLYQPSSFNTLTTWDGFTIQNGSAPGNENGGGAYLSSNGKLSHCVIRNNTASYGGGVYNYSAMVSNCLITNNSASSSGGGIDIYYGTMSNCQISNNTAYGGGGVYADYRSVVSNCLISNNSANGNGGGVYCYYTTITNSTIVRNTGRNGSGIYASSSGGSLTNSIVWGNGTNELNNMYGNINCSYSAVEGGCNGDNIVVLSPFNSPEFANPSIISGASDTTSNTDWHLLQGSVCINKGNNSVVLDSLDMDGMARVKRDTVDLGCYESDYYGSPVIVPNYTNIIYVTQNGSGNQTGVDWTNATSSLSFASIMARAYNADVWVAKGTYYGDTMSENAFVMVDGVNVYGGFAGNEPANYDLSMRDFAANATILDGQNARRVLGQPNKFNDTTTTWDGFSILNGYYYTDNYYDRYGGGVYLYNGVVKNCIIRNNRADRYGGGVYVCANGKIINCAISHNYSSYGGGIYVGYSYPYPTVNVVNCLVSNNDGGGIFSHYNLFVKNSTVVRNTRSDNSYDYGVNFSPSGSFSCELKNCIVWGNRSRYGLKNVSAGIRCSYSAIEGGFDGMGNIALDDECRQPLFVNPSLTAGLSDTTAGVDWHLRQGSVCINKGDNSAVTNNLDLDGTARVKRDTVDMGCYESDYYGNNTYDLPVVSTQLITDVTDSSALCGGTVSMDCGNSVTAYGVCWSTYPNPTLSDFYTVDGNGMGSFASTLSGLADATTYYVRAYATNSSGTSYGEERVFTTLVNYHGIIYVTQTGAGTRSGNSWANAVSSIDTAQTLAQANNAVVWVAAGTYYGDTTAANAFTMKDGVNVYGGFAGDELANYDLSLRDFEANTTILDGQNARRVLNQPNDFNNQTIWDGFTIQNGNANGYGGGAYLQYKGILNHCTVTRNSASRGGGIYAGLSTISKCIISKNTSNYEGGGMYAAYSTVSNCLISNNTSNSGGGIYASYTTIKNTTVVRNSSYLGSAGVQAFGSTTVENSIVWGNKLNGVTYSINGAVACSYSAIEGGCDGERIIELNEANLFDFVNPSLIAGSTDNTENVDWHLLPQSVCINQGNNIAVTDSLDLDGTTRIKCDTVDLGCYESGYHYGNLIQYDSIIYVTVTGAGTQTGENWANAISSIEIAQMVAQSLNAVVWVAAGTYYGDTTADNAFTMHDGVSVYGGFAGNEPANYDLSLRDFETNATILDGQNARRVLNQPSDFDTLTVWDGFTMQHGNALENGGGAYIRSNSIVRHCVFKDNVTQRSGGGLYVYIYYSGQSRVESCEILNNSAVYDGGGLYAYASPYYNSSVTATNCLFANNSASSCGGGIYGRCNIYSSTIVRNVSGSLGVGVPSITLVNCIVWGNERNGVTDNLRCESCTYSAVEGGYSGTGNVLLADYEPFLPLFANPSLTAGAEDRTLNVDWHLLPGSPCINRGNNNAVTDSLDLDGTPRIKRDIVDLGCYESDYVPNSIVYVTVSGAGEQTGENWANAISSIEQAQVLAQLHNAVVWVAAGTYYGDTTSDNAFTMHDGVSVYGGFAGNEPADYDLSQRDFKTNTTILDGQNARRVLNQPSDFGTLTVWDGFTVQHGQTTGYGGGANLRNNSIVRHCVIKENAVRGTGGGLYAYASSGQSRMEFCEILNNSATYDGGGFYAFNALATNCLVANNSAGTYGGGTKGYVNIYNTTIVRNVSGYSGGGVDGCNLANCIVWGNECNGVTNNLDRVSSTCTYSAVEGGASGEGNILLTDHEPFLPLFVNPSLTAGAGDSTTNVDWHLQNGSICVNRGNNSAVTDSLDLDGNVRIQQDTVDLGCYESDYTTVPMAQHDIVYVTLTGAGSHTGVSWDNAVSTIGEAQTLARSRNAVVWVAAGTYYGDTTSTSENAFTMVDGVSVYGGFAGNEPANYDLSQRDFEANTTILDGQNARRVLNQPFDFNTETKWDGFTIQNGYSFFAGGVYIRQFSTISNCIISNNISNGYYSGGGAGGIYADHSTISNCIISKNASYNGWGGNSGRNAGGIYAAQSTISNCIISNNFSNSKGGGIYASATTIKNTTVVRNSSNYQGAGVYGNYATVTNCIIWGNERNGTPDNLSGVSCTYSAVEGGYSGDNNIELNNINKPLFVNPSLVAGADDTTANVDWHLRNGSICVNRGNNDAVTDSLDLDGNARIQRDTVDMGCYESDYYSTEPITSVTITVVSNNRDLGSVMGTGMYQVGDTVALQALPNQNAVFLRWSDNDTTNPRYVIAEQDTTFTAVFEYYLPELHVTSISHSNMVGGQQATITWTVQNDGTASTPNGEVWYDRVWLSVENRVAAGDNNPILLGVFPNVSALAPGEFYTQTQTVDIPLSISGSYYLFVITDAYDAHRIYWDSVVPIPYNPPPYIGTNSHHCSGVDCGNNAGNKVLEISEVGNYPYWHDNFFYELVNITVPALPDLKVSYVFPSIQSAIPLSELTQYVLISQMTPVSVNVFSGSEIHIYYEVKNIGSYDTRVSDWQDVVIISNHPELDATARIIGVVPHNGLLSPDSSYQASTTVQIPLDMYDTVYFFVYTDYNEQVYEHVGRYNNVTRSNPVKVMLTPPADLKPRNIVADNTVSTGATFSFSYEIHNQGAGVPDYPTWRDRCYLSTNPNSINDAVQIADDWHYNGLAVGGSYSVSHTIALPSSISQGTYYLFVQADAMDDVFEYTYEENNRVRCAHPITVLQPDLQIRTLNVADTLHAGAEAGVSYRLANTGDGAIVNRDVTDGFYLSESSDGANAQWFQSFISNTWLNPHDSIMKHQNVGLPSDLQDGIYYLFARTNINNILNEANTDNNRSPIKPVYVNHQLLPDLVITSVTVPDTLIAGSSAVFVAKITNRGEKRASLNNLDFRLSVAAPRNNIVCTTESVSAGSQSLAVGDTTTVTLTIRISPAVSDPASFTLTVNPEQRISEYSYNNNDYAFSHAVQPYPFDLVVTDLVSPNQTISGESIPVTWSVQNQGSMPTIALPMYVMMYSNVVGFVSANLRHPWYDRIYLSTDSLFDAADVEIGRYTRNLTLYAGTSYTVDMNCRIPVATDGDYYVLVVSDATNVTFDSQRDNNVRGQRISVTQSALPDLRMDTLLASNTLTTGVTYNIRYTVSNRGEHVTHGDRWTDAVYINNRPSLQDAERLGSKAHFGLLDTNVSYTDSISVTIPNSWTGECYLIGYADATEQIVEMNTEANNLFIMPVSVARPLPCDLIVMPPGIPQSAIVGEDVNISWTLQNVGLNLAQGNIKEAVYLSTDSLWSSDDIMLGSVTYDISLAANGQQQRNATFPLQGVPTGKYYVVVRTNILNALNENSYTNNKAVSLTMLKVDYPSLYIDQAEHRQLNSGQYVYYKLEVGPDLVNQTLSCKLTSTSSNVSNGLYIAYSSAPSLTNFDWSATMPYVQEQEILIPALSQGIYYIMAMGQTSDNASQAVTLLATIINFEIISVNASSGANTGSVTTQIVGAKFDTIMDFRLANSNGYLPAEKVFFHNSTETYATFNLRDQEAGVYDMVAELPGGIITVKGQAFVVEQGLPAELLSNIIAPASVRSGNTFTVTIEYGNNGSTDLDISGFLLVSTNGFPIAFSSDSLANNATELTFETGEPNGNPDVIRPGHFATKTIFVKANRVGNINLKLYPIRRQY